MKYFSLVFRWAIVASLAIVCSSATMIQADPSDDFSFSLSHHPETDVYRLMSEGEVAEILSDRLDLFPVSQVPKLARHLVTLCKQYRFDPVFILSLIEVESRFKVKAVSHAGALGLMQVMPATAMGVTKEWGIRITERALFDPFLNISVGIAYLSWLREKYQHLSPYFLVAAYNAGPGKIDSIMDRKDFRPVATKKYFEDIRKWVPLMKAYQRQAVSRESAVVRSRGV